MPFRLYLHHTSYAAADIIQHAPAAAMQHEHERNALAFARQWLSGQQEFQVHTSGSTGAPKGILLHRKHMQASARLSLQALGISAGDTALLCINPAYIGGKMMLVRAMEANLPLYVVAPVANPLLEVLQRGIQPQFAALVPLQLQAIISHAESLPLLNGMKAVIIGGAPVSEELEAQLQEIKVPLYSTYGMTETVSHIALRRLNGPERQAYFQSLPEMDLAQDERGCLRIGGPVAPEPVQTNDVVELLAGGRFRWLGRADNVINSGGIKVQAERVEAEAARCLSGLGQGHRVLAGGRPDAKLGQKVALLLEGNALNREEEISLLECLAEKLPPYWVPKQILYVSDFVESANGKIIRKDSWQQR
jgi:o-succinylbenzoate---CoA ligase